MTIKAYFMKGFKTLVGALVSALLLTGCQDAHMKAVQDFADDLGRQASKNMIDSVVAKYPAVELADELSLAYYPDSIQVRKAAEEGIYEVRFNSKASMKVKVAEDGSIKVIESRGLFKYPEEKIQFAKNTGAFSGDIPDEELARKMIIVDNMATELFNKYVNSRKDAIKNVGFTMTKEPMFAMDDGEGYYTLQNTTDQPISADEYEITWSDSFAYGNVHESNDEIGKGRNIPANGTVRIPVFFSGRYFQEIRSITMKTPTQASFFRNYKPQGTEYAGYVDEHGEEITGKKLSDGPYIIAGSLGGRYPVHINLEKGMKKGTYYYDKNGSSNTIALSVKSFNRRTGEIIMEETNEKGEVTGMFTGKLTSTKFEGEMKAFTGKTYKFNLDVTNE